MGRISVSLSVFLVQVGHVGNLVEGVGVFVSFGYGSYWSVRGNLKLGGRMDECTFGCKHNGSSGCGDLMDRKEGIGDGGCDNFASEDWSMVCQGCKTAVVSDFGRFAYLALSRIGS